MPIMMMRYILLLICFSLGCFTEATFTTEGCGSTKGCFQLPNGCSPSSSGCTFFSWTWDNSSLLFTMELSGTSGGGSNYAAIAFARQKKMANADLYYCIGTALVTGAIQKEKDPPARLNLNSYPDIVVESTTSADGVGQCVFTRSASITKPVESGNQEFDFTDGTFWLMIAHGGAPGGNLNYHDDRAFSTDMVNMTAFTVSGGDNSKDILDKTHGALMILAWLVLVNIGAVIARHFKPLWKDTNPCGEKMWFQTHRTLMLLTLITTAIAFIIIFVEVGEYDASIGAHAIIGIVIMVLALLNPILALFRCHPNTPKRPIFNWVHYIIGTSARALGIANMFLGVELAALGLETWTTYLLAGFVGFVVVFELILEGLSWNYGHTACAQKNKKDDGPKPSDLQMEQDVRVRGQGIKNFFLAVYVIVVLSFAIVLWVQIGNA